MPRQRHDSKSLVGFLVGEVAYAVRIETVREIVNPLPTVMLPQAPAAVRGVADYRGVVVPVIDLRERFGLPPVTSRRTKWIVLDVGAGGDRFAALVVDAMTEVFGTRGEELRPAPPLGAGDDIRGIAGVTTHADRLIFVLEATTFGHLAEAALARVPPRAHDGAR